MWFRKSKPEEGSEKAVLDAVKRLREVQDRGPEVSEIADALRNIREKNHFADKLRLIMIGDGGPPG